MPRGKQKGYTKDSIVIKDKNLDPYYIVNEDRQFILMKEGNTLSQGYFTSLTAALHRASKELNLLTNRGKTMDLSEFIKNYDNVNKKILKALNL